MKILSSYTHPDCVLYLKFRTITLCDKETENHDPQNRKHIYSNTLQCKPSLKFKGRNMKVVFFVKYH